MPTAGGGVMTPEERAEDLTTTLIGAAAGSLFGLTLAIPKVREAVVELFRAALRQDLAAEREACAKVAEATNDCCECTTEGCCKSPCRTAAAIRARG